MQSAAYQGSFRLKHSSGLQVETIVLPGVVPRQIVWPRREYFKAKKVRVEHGVPKGESRDRKKIPRSVSRVAGTSSTIQHAWPLICGRSRLRLNSIRHLHIRWSFLQKSRNCARDRTRGTIRPLPLVEATIILVLRLFVPATMLLIKHIYLQPVPAVWIPLFSVFLCVYFSHFRWACIAWWQKFFGFLLVLWTIRKRNG